MYLLSGLVASLFATSALAVVSNPHKIRAPQQPEKRSLNHENLIRAASNHGEATFLTSKTEKFVVNGSAIPEVDFDIGESYAGTLSISDDPDDPNQLFFWFFPSSNPAAKGEITIWLNGGPGCSSMLGLLQENGPFLWQPGTFRPFANPYSYVNLTNMIWIDQPVGTGFSPATKAAPPKIKNEIDVAQDFMGFWKNWMETFDMVGNKVYITGESYAGQYIPYIAYEMLITNNTQYYNVAGIQVNDPSINHDSTMIYAPAIASLNNNANIFGLNDTTMDYLNEMNEKCGYASWLDDALSFPPKGPIPTAPSPNTLGPNCNLWGDAVTAAIYVNPCFNFYHITDFCPYLWDVFGFPSLGWGPRDYFGRADVQKAINAPPTDYMSCGDNTLGIGFHDNSIPSSLGPLPKVIDMTNNVIIGHGLWDFLLLANGSQVSIQNMTWNGKQGFQQKPSSPFFVPYHYGLAEVIYDIEVQPIPGPIVTNFAGAGYLGTTHTERGLTFVQVERSGHEIPEYVPGAAYRQLEFLLGRISSLSEISDFTTQKGKFYDGSYFNSTLRRV